MCIGAYGSGTERLPPPVGAAGRRDRLGRSCATGRVVVLDRSELEGSEDPLPSPGFHRRRRRLRRHSARRPRGSSWRCCFSSFDIKRTPTPPSSALGGFLEDAAPALGRALRSERKTVGMLRAIERLTNLYDLSKAFGSTIDWAGARPTLIARKAVDFAAAETASLWLLEGDDVVARGDRPSTTTTTSRTPPEPSARRSSGTSWRTRRPSAATGPRGRSRYGEVAALPDPTPSSRSRSSKRTPAIGALVLANKRGRHPEFSAEDEELLQDSRARPSAPCSTARQHEAEKKVEELDALLAVSREITSTLDLDKVMQTIVNATAALIPYDRCAIAILEKGKVRLGAISGADRGRPVEARGPASRRSSSSGCSSRASNVVRHADEDGAARGGPARDRGEVPRRLRGRAGLRSFHAVMLSDEEGKLGVLAFESREPLDFGGGDARSPADPREPGDRRRAQRPALPAGAAGRVLEAAAREAPQLLGDRRRRARARPGSSGSRSPSCSASPWRLRIAGPARILPGLARLGHGRRGRRRRVGAPATRATRSPRATSSRRSRTRRTGARSPTRRRSLAIAESDMARLRESGDAAAHVRGAVAPRRARGARSPSRRRSSRAPACARRSAGVIVTPRIEERVGQFLHRGDELARRRRRPAPSRPRSRCPRRTRRSSPSASACASEDQSLPDADLPGHRRAARRARPRGGRGPVPDRRGARREPATAC